MRKPIRALVKSATVVVMLIGHASGLSASPSTTGQTGLLNMPDANVGPDGTWRFGLSNIDPYRALWTSATLFPGFEFSARFTEIDGVPTGLGDGAYGDYKDKAFDAKVQLISDSGYLPAVAVGVQDFLGTQILPARYVVASKRFGDFEFTAGYGDKRIDGGFGGVSYNPNWAPSWSLIVESDAYDYENDFNAATSGVGKRDGDIAYGLEYRWGWLGAKVFRQGDDTGANFYVSIPLMQREFIPKLHEPAPDTTLVARPTLELWHSDAGYAANLVQTLEAQGFGGVKVGMEGRTLEASLTHGRITLLGRAAGRAARTLLLHSPIGTERIRITYTERDLPLLTYTFTDTDKLGRYFNGLMSFPQLENYIAVEFADPAYTRRFAKQAEYRVELERAEDSAPVITNEDGTFISIRKEDPFLNAWRIDPFNLGLFVNDPSGAFRYDVFATALYTQRLGHARFLLGGLRLTLTENVSGVSQESNSTLPHVRTDVALYKDEGPLKLDHLLVNQYLHPAPRIYARATAGLYEEMFGGFGGQVLYLPREGNWATDLSIDWLRQREVGGGFEFRDYDTVTALVAAHYYFPTHGITATARMGRFLAEDSGVRLELKRRFGSGIEVGMWYTVTDGNDITNPGTPDDPYYDKGLFMTIPLASMLTKDSRAHPRMSIAPWTRDVGQMVRSPGDLYRLLERRYSWDTNDNDWWTDFGQ